MKTKAKRAQRKRGIAALDELLTMAETLYVRYGYEGVSVRQIADAAEVNVGSVYYYCSSKEDLIRMAVERWLAPINAERARRFSVIERNPPADRCEALRAVILAFLEPTLTVLGATNAEARRARAVHSRVHHDAAAEIVKIVYDIYAEAGSTMLRLGRRFASHLTDEEYYWRIQSVLATAQFARVREPWVAMAAKGAFQGDDADEGVRQLVAMLHAGLMAPSLHR